MQSDPITASRSSEALLIRASNPQAAKYRDATAIAKNSDLIPNRTRVDCACSELSSSSVSDDIQNPTGHGPDRNVGKPNLR